MAMMAVQRVLPGILGEDGEYLSATERARMKGFVPTPQGLVDLMVDKLFAHAHPSPDSTVLDPGCGAGAFVGGILRWCDRNRVAVPQVLGVESDSRHLPAA